MVFIFYCSLLKTRVRTEMRWRVREIVIRTREQCEWRKCNTIQVLDTVVGNSKSARRYIIESVIILQKCVSRKIEKCADKKNKNK